MITLGVITESNLRDCLKLDAGDGKKGFVATSFAIAWVYRVSAEPLIIYNNGEPVGFVHEFTWSVSGNKIILKTYNRCTGKIEEINEGGVPINYTYGISGNTLTLNLKASRRYTVTDVSGIHINENNNINIPAGNRDNRLILPDNRAWVTDYRYCTNDDDTVYTMRENREGHMFRSDGSYVYIYQDERWHGYVEGTWSTNGNELILEREWYDDSSIYTVSGNNLTFEFSMSFSYTKTGGIVLTRIYDSWEDYQRDNTVIYNMSKRPTRDRPLSPMLRRPGLMGSR